MKRNTIIAILLFLLLASAGTMKAQGYQSYFGCDSTRLAIYEVGIDFDDTYNLTINRADTVKINGRDYLQGSIQDGHGSLDGYQDFFFREDTVFGKLYRYYVENDEETLLSDMSLEVGDSFSFTDDYGVHSLVVESISYPNGRKAIHFGGYYGDRYSLVEGIFPSFHPIGFNGSVSEIYLLCEYQDGEQIFHNPHFDSCYISSWFIPENSQNQVSVYPSDVRHHEAIHIEAVEPILDVVLIDLHGREIPLDRCQDTPQQWTVSIPTGISGICIFRITTKKGMYYEKIIANT